MRKIRHRHSGATLWIGSAGLAETGDLFPTPAPPLLRGAALKEADLFQASLAGEDMRGTDLYGALLVEADLTATDLSGARLDRLALGRLAAARAVDVDEVVALGKGIALAGGLDIARQDDRLG